MAAVEIESLDKKVTDRDVDKLADFMTEWERMRGPLGLNHAIQREIENIHGYGNQKRECIEEWREKAGEKASYRAFVEAAREVGMNGLADKVVDMLRDREAPAEGGLRARLIYVAAGLRNNNNNYG